MQIKIISIPVIDGKEANSELNKFLRSVKVLEIEQKLVENRAGCMWTFCIRYIDTKNLAEKVKKDRVDYKSILSEKDFNKFTQLRAIRKKIAEEDGLPAFAVFTNEELSGLATLENLTPDGMKKVKGIGEKKVEKYASRLIKAIEDEEN